MAEKECSKMINTLVRSQDKVAGVGVAKTAKTTADASMGCYKPVWSLKFRRFHMTDPRHYQR